MAQLIPRSYCIQQNTKNYVYFVVWINHIEKWVIKIGNLEMYMTNNLNYDYEGHDTKCFDTAEDALKFWESQHEQIK